MGYKKEVIKEVVLKELVENGGTEVIIHLNGNITFGEFEKKMDTLLSIFDPETVSIASIKHLSEDEERIIREGLL